MKKSILLLALLILVPSFLFSQRSQFTYIEGDVSLRRGSGSIDYAEVGDYVNLGDSVLTGEDGFAELSLENSSTITIDKDTVFLFTEKKKEEEKKSIFMVILGKIKFKFNRLIHEPDIETPATIAGIRGTEFTVLSALDGSALYVVDEGSVAVEAEGSLVLLEMEEGVEVALGKEPGKKFEVKIGKIDYSDFLTLGDKAFEEDPASALAQISEKLTGYISEVNRFYELYNESYDGLIKTREGLDDAEESGGKEGKLEYFNEFIMPLENSVTDNAMNYRYYALSALSLRRYVISSMYIEMKTKYILDSENPKYQAFLKEYEDFLLLFEDEVIKVLVEADI